MIDTFWECFEILNKFHYYRNMSFLFTQLMITDLYGLTKNFFMKLSS